MRIKPVKLREDKTDLERDTSKKWRFEERSERDGWWLLIREEK